MLHHIIPYILGFITLPSILKLLSFIPKRPVNLIAGFVLPNADDPGWEEMGGYWKLGNVVVMNFNKIEIKGIKVHTSPKLIKKYQEAIRTAYMHYHLDMPEIKVKDVFEPDKDYITSPKRADLKAVCDLDKYQSYCRCDDCVKRELLLYPI